LADQTRLQPEFVTFAFFLAAGLPGTAGLTLARVYLITLKVLRRPAHAPERRLHSQHDTWMLRTMVGDASPLARAVFPWTIVATEIGVALLALAPRTRRFAVVGAFLLHGGILLSLVRAGWNHTVWPWNLLCAVAGVFVILPWTRSLRDEWRAARPAVRVAAVVLAVYPLGFYAGIVDAYLSHSLYALDQPRGFVCNLSGDAQPERPGLGDTMEDRHADGPFQCREISVSDALGVPLPPIHRLFEDYFTRTCAGGEFLLIVERRRFTADDDRQRAVYCPSAGAPSPETRL
jgi:hypothetical protein